MNGRVYTPRFPAPAVEEHMEMALAGAEHSMPPLVCRWPRTAAPRGFVVFCHGLGASGRDYAGLSRLWASHGYLVIHPTFPDSIATVARNEPTLGLGAADDPGEWMKDERLRAHMHGLLHTPRYWLERIRIVGAVMDRLPTILDATCGQPVATLPGAIAGHSFGAYTAQLLAGATIDLPGKGPRHFRDDRFAAAILLSAQGRDQQGLRDGSWDGISGPMLNVTGTRDGGAGGAGLALEGRALSPRPAGPKVPRRNRGRRPLSRRHRTPGPVLGAGASRDRRAGHACISRPASGRRRAGEDMAGRNGATGRRAASVVRTEMKPRPAAPGVAGHGRLG